MDCFLFKNVWEKWMKLHVTWSLPIIYHTLHHLMLHLCYCHSAEYFNCSSNWKHGWSLQALKFMPLVLGSLISLLSHCWSSRSFHITIHTQWSLTKSQCGPFHWNFWTMLSSLYSTCFKKKGEGKCHTSFWKPKSPQRHNRADTVTSWPPCVASF